MFDICTIVLSASLIKSRLYFTYYTVGGISLQVNHMNTVVRLVYSNTSITVCLGFARHTKLPSACAIFLAFVVELELGRTHTQTIKSNQLELLTSHWD